MGTKSDEQNPLRMEAEAQLADRPQAGTPAQSAEELLHELSVHQIELEMQNDELRRTQLSLAESRDRYMNLYEFAPAGYLTLTREGIIDGVNLSGAELLGVVRKKLLNHRFADFVSASDRERWHRHFLYVLQHVGRHSFELALRRDDDSVLHVQLDCLHMGVGSTSSVRIAFTDISERKRSEQKLLEYQQLLRDLAAQGVTSREAQCRHISREVHDELGQLLMALRFDISLLGLQFGGLNPALIEKTQNMLDVVDSAIRGVRDVAINLRPPVLDMGIIPAIEWLRDVFPHRTSTACILRVVDTPTGLNEERTVAIFRIVQESLSNAVRHAAASNIEITIRQYGEDVTVEVRDNGKGFDPTSMSLQRSFGLLGMRERAIAVGGVVEIDSTPSKGTVVSARIPINPASPV